MKFGYGNMGIGRGAGEEMCVTCGVVCRRGGMHRSYSVFLGGLCWTPPFMQRVGWGLAFPISSVLCIKAEYQELSPSRHALMVVRANDHLS